MWQGHHHTQKEAEEQQLKQEEAKEQKQDDVKEQEQGEVKEQEQGEVKDHQLKQEGIKEQGEVKELEQEEVTERARERGRRETVSRGEVEFVHPKLKDALVAQDREGEDGVWLTSYSRIPVSAGGGYW